MRNKFRTRKLLKDDVYPLEFLKELIEGVGLEGRKRKERYQWLQDNVVEYVRKGLLQEARYLLQFDFENDCTDLNRLYHCCLSGELPDRIIRISVSKQSYHHRLLSPLHCACINPNP